MTIPLYKIQKISNPWSWNEIYVQMYQILTYLSTVPLKSCLWSPSVAAEHRFPPSKFLYLAQKITHVQKAALILVFLFFLSCSDDNNDPNQILPIVPVNETIFLNNPEFINLQVVGGWSYAQGGISGLIIYHSGINTYLAYERSAPHLTPRACSQMKVVNGLVMVCPCDESEFNILNGAPLTEGVKYAARQYRVQVAGNSTLIITNY